MTCAVPTGGMQQARTSKRNHLPRRRSRLLISSPREVRLSTTNRSDSLTQPNKTQAEKRFARAEIRSANDVAGKVQNIAPGEGAEVANSFTFFRIRSSFKWLRVQDRHFGGVHGAGVVRFLAETAELFITFSSH